MENNYKVIKDGNRYTIGEYDKGYNAYIVNDGICCYYWWPTEAEAQAAADAINRYGSYWLGQHGYGNDRLSANDMHDVDPDMWETYRLFHAIDDDDKEEQK